MGIKKDLKLTYLGILLIVLLSGRHFLVGDSSFNRIPYGVIVILSFLGTIDVAKKQNRISINASKSFLGGISIFAAMASYYISGIELIYLSLFLIFFGAILFQPDKRWLYSGIVVVCICLGWSISQGNMYNANRLSMLIFSLIMVAILLEILSEIKWLKSYTELFQNSIGSKKDQSKDNNPFILSLLIIGLILLPLLLPTAYIFALDHVRNPFGFYTNDLGSWQLVPRIYNLLLEFSPGWIAEKIIIITSFVAGVYGMYSLLNKKNFFGGIDSIFATAFAILGLFFNPFFYGRFVDGQSNVYMSLLMLPYLIYALLRILDVPTIKKYIVYTIVVLIYGGLSTHNLLFLMILLPAATIIFWQSNFSYLKNIIIIGILSILAALPRTFITFYGGAQTDVMISNFDQTHLSVFQPQPLPHQSFFVTMATLQGYWGESMNRFQPSYLTNSQRGGVWILMMFLMIVGFVFVFKSNNKTLKKSYLLLFVMGVVGFVLGGGTSWGGPVGSLTQRLYDHILLYRGLREPHKWMMWTVLFYCISGSFGIKYLFDLGIKHIEEKWITYTYIAILTIVPIISTPALLFGAQGQIKMGIYPAEWYLLRNTLKDYQGGVDCGAVIGGKEDSCRTILVLPWHGYLSFPFTQGRVIANPIYSFMGNTGLMVSDTVEIASLYSQTTKRENILYQNEIYPQLSGLLYESDLDHSRSFDFVNDAIIRKVSHKFAFIGIKDVIVFKTSSDWKTDVDRLSFLVLHGYASIEETNDQYVWYKLQLDDRLLRD